MSAATTTVQAAPPAAGTGRHRRHSRAAWLWAPAVFVAAVLVRAVGNAQGYDVFVDEVTYLRVSQSVANDLSVHLYGEPFFLHPPALFFLEAGWLHLFGQPPDVIDAVLLSRWLVFLLAGVTAVLAVRLAHVLAGRWAGGAAAILILLDPFVVRINSRNLLETPTLMFVLGGILVLATPLARGDRPTLRRSAVAGLLLGLGVLTKDTAALAVSLPLLYLLVRRETRVPALVAGACLVAAYLPYPAVTALTGHWGQLVDEKSVGVLRLSGHVQLTGFNAPGASSFTERVVERLSFYGASYALMAAGVAATVYLLARGGAAARLVGWWAASSYLLAAYSIVRGTLEEQLFYFVLVPAVVAVPVAGCLWWAGRDRPSLRDRAWAGALLLTVWVAAAALSFGQVHTQRDDAYSQMVDYIGAELAPSQAPPRIGVTSDPASVLLKGTEIFRVGTSADVRRNRVGYVLVSTRAVENGTASVEPSLRRLMDEGTLVHEVKGRSVGRLKLVRVNPAGG